MLILQSTYTGYSNNTAVIHTSQVPPNPAIFAPGPALLFVVVRGVPSVGVQIMIGSGQLGTQPVLDVGILPPSEIVRNDTVVKTDPDAGAGGAATKKSGASASRTFALGSDSVLLRTVVIMLLVFTSTLA